MLRTFLTERWGLRYPIINASMTPAATGRLARAVSDAGGLGMIGVNETWTPDDVERECATAREGNGGRMFGLGFFGWAIEQRPELLEAAIAARPFLISISFVDVSPYAPAIHDAGILLGAQVQSRADAEAALTAGVDILVAQGTEAGGHTGDVSTLVMMQIALAISHVPVVVAGGVGSPAGVASVIAAGAAGAWVGTPFLLSQEADVKPEARARILAARENETVLTSLYDRLYGQPWPSRFRGRALDNAFTREWHGREEEALADPTVRERLFVARAAADFGVANVYAGQIAGLLDEPKPAATIVRDLGEGAERILRTRLDEVLR